MQEPIFTNKAVSLIGFYGGVPDRIRRAKPIYKIQALRAGTSYAIGGLYGGPLILSDMAHEDLEAMNNITLLDRHKNGLWPGGMVLTEETEVILVSDQTAQRLDAVIPDWREGHVYRAHQKLPVGWLALPTKEAASYMEGIVGQLREAMDAELRRATGKGDHERVAEDLGWIAWDCLETRDQMHRRQIMVRQVAARRLRHDEPPKRLADFMRAAAKSLFLKPSEASVKIVGELVDRYLARLRRSSDEPSAA